MASGFVRYLKLPKGKLSLYEKVWLGAPLAVWFSFQPFMRFGQDSTMYFELSIALLYLVILAITGVPHILRSRTELIRQPAVWLVGSYVALMIASLLWTPNLVRGLLTIGVTGLLYMIFLAGMARTVQIRSLVPALVRLYIVAAVVMSALAVVQLVTGIWLDSSVTLLCAGCVAEQFGFARPNVFAIEPQFFGSLLLAPALVLFNRLATDVRGRYEMLSFVIISLALFLTLSRGAIVAWVIGVLIIVALRIRQVRHWSKAVALVVGVFILSLTIQGSAAAVNPTINETFTGTVTKVINQLSLGVIDIRADQPEPVEVDAAVPHFDGYVEESTDVRVSRSALALQTWVSSLPSIVVGVGVGGAGVAVHDAFPERIGSREIVQNQYVETLLEQGVVGLLLFMAMLVGLIITARRHAWVWAIVAAYMFQWLFFSGYPNALHVYLVLIVIYVGVNVNGVFRR